jgi:hypothetical protein
VECGTVTLTRRIPYGLGWRLIRPFVETIPRDSLEEMVQGTRVSAHKQFMPALVPIESVLTMACLLQIGLLFGTKE